MIKQTINHHVLAIFKDKNLLRDIHSKYSSIGKLIENRAKINLSKTKDLDLDR